MLIASAETFWKAPNVYDALGVVGFIVGILSVWASWWLANRDIRRRLEDAAENARNATREEAHRAFRQLVTVLLRRDVSEVKYQLGVARESCVARQWVRAAAHLEVASNQMYRVHEKTDLAEPDRARLREAISDVADLIAVIRRKKEPGAGALTPDQANLLERLIGLFASLDGQFENIMPGG